MPAIPYHQQGKLEKRKSKIFTTNVHHSSIYLDIVNLPQITRNVSETQLLALKNAGSKALSNMTQQFSKLNKLGTSFKQSKKQPVFTIGKNKLESSSDSEEEYENSIFQPNLPQECGTPLQYPSDSSSSTEKNDEIEEALEATEDSKVDKSTSDVFLPSVGIVMGAKNESPNLEMNKNAERQNVDSSSQVNNIQLRSIMENVYINTSAPEIQINSEEICDTKKQPPTSLKLDRKLSHSSGEVDTSSVNEEDGSSATATGDQEVILNISQSQSESALKNKLQNLTSPVASVTKGLVLSPFTKLAKGVQNLGANLDPRKIGVRQITEKEYEEHRKMQEKWRNCKTRLIAL